ncbi:MAG TPA: 1-acyl-sn-glycerol-3-phosphate acyltransferase [Actinomycetota bacterium]|nr:1-acyl-sn-glycerol-3-phosphate acyltransferase [Actinomycetota bacterium]
MDRLPPRIVRRLILAPVALVLSLALLALSPVLIGAAAIADLFLPGSARTARLVAFAECYLALEVAGLLVMFVLWIASGFGLRIRSERMQDAHYGFMRWWLRQTNHAVRRLFRLSIHIEDPPGPRPGPILVFSRHAGPGNSLLLIGTLLVGFKRHPRIVMLAKLQWEPLYDTMLNRLPNRFIRQDPSRRDLYTTAISDLARDLGQMDAFVLFPEGKDFTPRVRMRAIEYLRGKGYTRSAVRAEKMEHVLPPRHNGVIAAIDSATDADIVLVAHSVLEDIGSFKDLWSRIPLEHPVHARYWRIPPSEVPHDRDAVIEWLYEWWERIDRWIEDREAAVLP